MSNKETVKELNNGYRHDKPENCPQEMYQIMKDMWSQNPEDRPTFRQVSERINAILRTLEVSLFNRKRKLISSHKLREKRPRKTMKVMDLMSIQFRR